MFVIVIYAIVGLELFKGQLHATCYKNGTQGKSFGLDLQVNQRASLALRLDIRFTTPKKYIKMCRIFLALMHPYSLSIRAISVSIPMEYRFPAMIAIIQICLQMPLKTLLRGGPAMLIATKSVSVAKTASLSIQQLVFTTRHFQSWKIAITIGRGLVGKGGAVHTAASSTLTT